MVCGQRDNKEGFCGHVLWCWQLWLQELGKNYSGISKVYDPRCIRIMNRSHLRCRLAFSKEGIGVERDYLRWPAQLGVCDQTVLCGDFWPLSLSACHVAP